MVRCVPSLSYCKHSTQGFGVFSVRLRVQDSGNGDGGAPTMSLLRSTISWFWVLTLGSARVQGSTLGFKNSSCVVQSERFRDQGFGAHRLGSEAQALAFTCQGLGFKHQNLRFSCQSSGFRQHGLQFMYHVMGFTSAMMKYRKFMPRMITT